MIFYVFQKSLQFPSNIFHYHFSRMPTCQSMSWHILNYIRTSTHNCTLFYLHTRTNNSTTTKRSMLFNNDCGLNFVTFYSNFMSISITNTYISAKRNTPFQFYSFPTDNCSITVCSTIINTKISISKDFYI